LKLNVIFNFRDAPMPLPQRDRAESSSEADDCRCLCGSLLARVVDGQVELKCRRCKRTLRVPLSDVTAGEAPVQELAERRAL
jgi:phage FluMu protein Com